ncbi:MAG: DUF4038 domain-containing protein [Armatimonadota bacterium]
MSGTGSWVLLGVAATIGGFVWDEAVSQTAAQGELVYPGQTWEVRAPADLGLDAGGLREFSRRVGGRGCVVRGGYLVFTWGDAAGRGDVASAAKPWYAHFLLRALEDGRVPSLDQAVVEVEPRLGEINAALGYKDGAITWRHMANQVSCYGVAEEPGMAYDYNDWQMALFWDCLFLRVYGATWETVDEAVLHPLLTDELGCEDDPTFMAFGTGDRPGRLAISPRDFARFGLLYLRGGRWRDRQLISPEHARMAVTSPLPNSIPRTAGVAAEMIAGQRTLGSRNVPDNQGDHLGSYSWLWWTNGVSRTGERHWPSAPTDTFAALGHNGREGMVVVPSLDLIASWNQSAMQGAAAQDAALAALVGAVEPAPMRGQIVADPKHPQWLRRHGAGAYFMCGPGDPEDFLYRGELQPDGTRAGDQEELIARLAETGANCIYLQAVRSHGGDGDPTHNPFVGHDPAQGLSETVLQQWEGWFRAMDQAGITIFLFIYDDSARIWDTGDEVGEAEADFLRTLVNRLEHHRNLIWCVAEEYQERYSPARVSAIAATTAAADDHHHPIAVHKLHGLDFAEFADDPSIDQFAIQYNVPTAEELHAGLVRAWAEAGGRYNLNLAEAADFGTGPELRRKLWACAMAGAYVMVLGMDIASTPAADLEACGHLARFMEASPLAELAPHDELARGDTEYVLAAPGRVWVAWSGRRSGEMGVRALPAGRYALTWLDCATGRSVQRRGVRVAGGDATWPAPAAIGAEAALRVERTD